MKKRIISIVLCFLIIVSSMVISAVSASAWTFPTVVVRNKDIIANIGENVNVVFEIYHEYKTEKINIDVYNSKNEVVASSTDFFDMSDSDYQHYSFTWFTKDNPAGTYKLLATMAYFDDGWVLAPTDTEVTITLKGNQVPAQVKTLNTVKKTVTPSPKIKKAVSAKGSKIKAKWSAVKNAKKYQIAIGSKKFTVKKTSYTSKKLKKGKIYSVKVRAYANKKWTKWSKKKRIKVIK